MIKTSSAKQILEMINNRGFGKYERLYLKSRKFEILKENTGNQYSDFGKHFYLR